MDSFSNDNGTPAPKQTKATPAATPAKDKQTADTNAPAPQASDIEQATSKGETKPDPEPAPELPQLSFRSALPPAMPVQIVQIPVPAPVAAPLTADISLEPQSLSQTKGTDDGTPAAKTGLGLPDINPTGPNVAPLQLSAEPGTTAPQKPERKQPTVLSKPLQSSLPMTPPSIPLPEGQEPKAGSKVPESLKKAPETSDTPKASEAPAHEPLKVPSWVDNSLSVTNETETAKPASETRPPEKSADSQQIAFSASIKESGQTSRQQSNSGNSKQQESPNHDRFQPEPTTQSGLAGGAALDKAAAEIQFAPKAPEIQKPVSPAPILETAADKPVSASPMTSISLKVDSLTSPGVDVKLVERGGTIQVSVRTGDKELTGDIRQNLDQLVDNLSSKGFETQTWTPDSSASEIKRQDSFKVESSPTVQHTAISSSFQAQNDSRNLNQGDSGNGKAFEDSSGGRHSKGDGRGTGQQGGRQDNQGQSAEERARNMFRTILEGARP